MHLMKRSLFALLSASIAAQNIDTNNVASESSSIYSSIPQPTSLFTDQETTRLSGTRFATPISTATGLLPSIPTTSSTQTAPRATASGTATAAPRYTPSASRTGDQEELASLSSVVSSLSSVVAEASEMPNVGNVNVEGGVRGGVCVGVAGLIVGLLGMT